MKYCYLCHDPVTVSTEGIISYTESSDPSDTLYACGSCVGSLGMDEAFNQLEEHYEHRASMRDTLGQLEIDKSELSKLEESTLELN
jgi:hypothetical protein